METTQAIVKLSALAQASRLDVFRLLVKKGLEGLSAGDIAQTTGILPNTLSFHLKELSQAGLIYSEREGRHIIYKLQVEGMRSLIHFLTDDCCQGNPELCLPASKCC